MEMTGLKSKFQRESATPGTYDDIAQVASIQPPQPERDMAEVDDIDPVDGIKKKLAGTIDAGEVSLTLNFDPADVGHTTLEADFWAGSEHNYRIVLPSGNQWTFAAILKAWSPQELTSSDVIQVEATFSVNTKPAFA